MFFVLSGNLKSPFTVPPKLSITLGAGHDRIKEKKDELRVSLDEKKQNEHYSFFSFFFLS